MHPSSPSTGTASFFTTLRAYVEDCEREFGSIETDRKTGLQALSRYVSNCLAQATTPKLTFICTHNSRRSHLSQIWAQLAADWYGIPNVETYSGGTEATAFNDRAVQALRRCGFKITTNEPHASNPRYEVIAHDAAKAQVCFSKKYDAAPNPTKNYCAVMTCSQADEACPVVFGSDVRVTIRYEDPKAGDGTPHEAEVYDERSRQICREMLYMMSKVQNTHEHT